MKSVVGGVIRCAGDADVRLQGLLLQEGRAVYGTESERSAPGGELDWRPGELTWFCSCLKMDGFPSAVTQTVFNFCFFYCGF